MAARVILRCFATLRQHLATCGGKEAEVTLEGGRSPLQALQHFGIPQKEVHLVLVNGVYLDVSQWGEHRLNDGDVVSVWPPVAGG